MNNVHHEGATQYANRMLDMMGMQDQYSIDSGAAEMLWDLAYDAYMWRNVGGTIALPGSNYATLAAVIQTDYADEEDDTCRPY